MKIIDYFGWKVWTKEFKRWLSGKLESITVTVDLSSVAKEKQATDNKDEILDAIGRLSESLSGDLDELWTYAKKNRKIAKAAL